MAKPDIQRNPEKLRLIKCELEICFFKLFIFIYGFSATLTTRFLLKRSNGKITRNKHFSSQENDDIFRIIFPNEGVRYRCKSDIAIFAWRVT